MKKSQLNAISYSYSKKSKEKAIEKLKEAKIYSIFLAQKYLKIGYKTEKAFYNAYLKRSKRFNNIVKKVTIFFSKCIIEKEQKNIDISLNKYDINSYQDLKSYVFFLKVMFKL